MLVERLRVRDLSPQALILADLGHRSISAAIGQVAEADVVVVATPVYKAAYSGVLKVFLDLLPQDAFKRVPVRDLQNPALRNLARLDQALSEETPSISHFPVQIDI